MAAVSLSIIGTLRPARPLPFTLPELSPGGLAKPPAAGAPGSCRFPSRSAPPYGGAVSGSSAGISERACLPGDVPYGPARWRRCTCSGTRSGSQCYRRAWPGSTRSRCGRAGCSPGRCGVRRGSRRPARLAADRQPPVRDTALAVLALAEACLPADHQALVSAGSWLLAQRIEGPAARGRSRGRRRPDGRLAVTTTRSRPTPPRSCSRSAVSMLPTVRPSLPCGTRCAGSRALRRAMAAGAVPLSRPRSWCMRWPGTVRRTPARCGTGLSGCCGRSARTGRGQAGPGLVDLRATALTLPALVAAGVLPGKHAIRTAVEWLLDCQNMDAGWAGGVFGPAGEDRASRNTTARTGAPGGRPTGDRHASRSGTAGLMPTARRWPWARCSPPTVPRLRTRLISRLTGWCAPSRTMAAGARGPDQREPRAGRAAGRRCYPDCWRRSRPSAGTRRAAGARAADTGISGDGPADIGLADTWGRQTSGDEIGDDGRAVRSVF